VDFDLMMKRLGAYKTHEKQMVEQHQAGHPCKLDAIVAGKEVRA
jgi:hypothetical protein